MRPKKRILPVFVPHLGCPHACVFCNQHRISGAAKPVTASDVDAAVRKAGEETPGLSIEVAFYGGSFTAIDPGEQKALLSALAPWRENGTVSGVRVSTRPDCITEEILATLSRYGVETVELGVQSMDEDVLRLSGRGHTSEDAVNAAKLVKAAGLRLILQMMTGLPGDTAEKSLCTAERLISLKPDGVRIYPTVVIRDTALYDLWQKGDYTPQSVGDAADLCALLWEKFDAANIPVIRCGLNPTEELSGGDAASGAYHPAFGELVLGRKYRRKMEALLEGDRGEEAVFAVSRGQLSAALGHKRENVRYLTEKYGLNRLEIHETDIQKGEIRRISVAIEK